MVRGERRRLHLFGLAGNRALHRLAYDVADDLKVRRAEAGAEKMRSFAAFDYAAGSWNRERRVVARLEATARGFDARYIVTSLGGDARHLYEDIYCARGQAENLIKLHKGQLASDRTSCQSPIANQFRLVLHTAAYWLMLALRDAVPRRMPLAWAEFATLRQRLLKIGARVVEKAARIRIHFASACPDAALWRANRNRADAGHDLAFGQVAVAHQPSAAFFGARLGVAIKERGYLRLDRPRQQGPGAAAQHLGQRIGKRRWLGKLQNGIVTHGVSLLRWRSGGSITPTIRRLNP